MTYRVGEFFPSDMAEMGESTLPLELFLSFVLESERCGCQQRNAVNGKERKGKGDQTSTAEQYLRNIIAQGGNFVIDSLSYWKPVQFSQKW